MYGVNFKNKHSICMHKTSKIFINTHRFIDTISKESIFINKKTNVKIVYNKGKFRTVINKFANAILFLETGTFFKKIVRIAFIRIKKS